MATDSEFIRLLNEKNLCTWYVLPLLGLNRFSFQESNYVDSYLTRDGRMIGVEVIDRNLCSSVFHNQHFLGRRRKDGNDLLLFVIQGAWKKDMELFMQGQYSKMSNFAKELIRNGSGLKYNVWDEEHRTHRTDAILLALEKNEALRDAWVKELTTDVLHQRHQLKPEDLVDTELLSPPSENSYIEI